MSDIKDQLDQVDGHFDRYRSAGLAFTAAIIALSGGTIIGLVREKIWVSAFALPIMSSLVQQLMHFLGSKYKARAHFKLFHSSLAPDLKIIRDEADFNKCFSDFFFDVSDLPCFISFIFFTCCSLALLWFYTSIIIWGVVLLIGIFLIWYFCKYSKIKLNLEKNFQEQKPNHSFECFNFERVSK